jgi:hypothetical protein
MLDILEDYCQWKEFEYCRIDGGTDYDTRNLLIDEFTKPDSEKFIFLLSTRAGGNKFIVELLFNKKILDIQSKNFFY